MRISTKRANTILIGTALVAAISLAACSSTSDRVRLDGTGPQYPTVEALTAAADVVVVAIPTDSQRRTVEGDPEAGLPVVYREFTVGEVLFDPNGFVTSDTIDVSLLDTDQLLVDQQSDIRSGERLLLYLDRISAAEVTAIKPLEQVFTPLSYDNGILDVSEAGTLTARSSVLKALNDGDLDGAPANQQFQTSIDAVRAVIASANDATRADTP